MSLLRLFETLIIALVGLAAIILVGRPVARRLYAQLTARPALASAAAGTSTSTAIATADASALPGQEGEEGMVSLDMVEGQMRASSILRVQQLVESHPEKTLEVVRSWLAAGDKA
jgi:flagellar M-ring protein FliF